MFVPGDSSKGVAIFDIGKIVRRDAKGNSFASGVRVFQAKAVGQRQRALLHSVIVGDQHLSLASLGHQTGAGRVVKANGAGVFWVDRQGGWIVRLHPFRVADGCVGRVIAPFACAQQQRERIGPNGHIVFSKARHFSDHLAHVYMDSAALLPELGFVPSRSPAALDDEARRAVQDHFEHCRAQHGAASFKAGRLHSFWELLLVKLAQAKDAGRRRCAVG